MSLGAFAQVDMSSYIKNNDFTGCSKGNFPDWTISAGSGNVQNWGETCAEYWVGTAANGNFDYYQEITELPNGKYTVSAKMWNSTNGVAGVTNGNAGVYASNIMGQIFAGVTDDCDGDGRQTYTTTESIVVADGKLRVGVKNIGTMGARWFGVDFINLTKVGDLTAEDEAAYEAAKAYADTFAEVPATDAANWSASNGQNLGLMPDWPNATGYKFVEAYNGGSHPADFTMSTQLSLEPNTNYLITVVGAASYTSGRGFECPTGTAADELTGLFASTTKGEDVVYIPVVERTSLANGANDEATLLVKTGEDGVVTAGIKNFQLAGNWYGCAIKTIQKVEVENWSCDVTAKVTLDSRSVTKDQNVEYAIITTNKTGNVTLPAAEANGWKMAETVVRGATYTVDEDGIKTFKFPAATITFTKNGETVVATVDTEKSSATVNATSLHATIYATSSKGELEVIYSPAIVEKEEALTNAQFMVWDGVDATAKPLEDQTGKWCDYVLNKSTGMPYGNGTVDWKQYADLSAYKSLVVVATEGTPRFFLNRMTSDGQAKDGKAIDTNLADHFNAYVTKVDNGDGTTTFTLDVAKIVEEQGFAHLNVIKGGNWANTTVTSMTLVKEEESQPTGVDAVVAAPANAPVKYVKNGKIVIVKDGKAYNVAGQEM